jgi:excisionase family DNA binding protein
MDSKDVLMEIETAAEIIGVKRRTLLRWAREGRIAVHDFGKVKRFARSDLTAFLASHRKPAIQ